MDYEEYKKIILSGVEPLSRGGDLAAVSKILKFFKPKQILELGVGNGDWLIFMAAALKDPNIVFVGYENFTWKFNDSWCNNLSSLQDRIQKFSNTLDFKNKFELRDDNINTIEFNKHLHDYKFDVVRLDCLQGEVKEIELIIDKILPYTSKNCIFLMDDINPNYVPNRYLACMEKVKQGKFIPLWFGSEEGAWIRSPFDSNEFLDHAKTFNSILYETNLITQNYFGTYYNYFITKSLFG
jgi:hypothetical protein